MKLLLVVFLAVVFVLLLILFVPLGYIILLVIAVVLVLFIAKSFSSGG